MLPRPNPSSAISLLCITDLQRMIKPRHRLRERLFLRKMNQRLAQVTTNGKSVRNPAKQINLEGLPSADQSFLGCVAIRGSEDRVVL